MTVAMIHDKGQTLGEPRNKLVGIVDTQAAFDAVTKKLQDAGFTKIEGIRGEEGVALLERVEGFFFSDMEERILERHVEELKAGHIIIAIETPSERTDEAVKIASQNGARRLVHFGLMTVTWLTK